MRLVADGPDIPNKIIREWRDGQVLFLAGAGVSVPSKLPLFDGLALKVYQRLNDPLFKVLKAAQKQKLTSGKTNILEAADVNPRAHVEADLFFGKQFDRLFSVLEEQIDPDTKGRAKTRNVRSAVEHVLSGRRSSTNHRDLLRLSLAPNAADDRSRDLSCRIVTTNFDRLFEDAWRNEFGAAPISFDARVAPRPGAYNFEGIIHLHGALNEKRKLPGDYILSSRDFARAYLRSGVIGNYIYDLIRRYRIILVGYSADDPPMRYLMDAIGEDASLFSDMKEPYALTNVSGKIGDRTATVEEENWKAKEITPIFFERRSGGEPYAPLWETLHQWADWARDEFSWIERQLIENTRQPRTEASAFQRSFVQDLLGTLSADELQAATVFLAERRVDFSWIETIVAAVPVARTPSERSFS